MSLKLVPREIGILCGIDELTVSFLRKQAQQRCCRGKKQRAQNKEVSGATDLCGDIRRSWIDLRFKGNRVVAGWRFPLVIGLGPVRCGTSWIHALLYGHSQVCTTREKEINFFKDHFEKGPDWYRRQFVPETADTRLYADISPLYIMVPESLERIRQSVPSALFLVGLRSPYARVLSWYRAEIHARGEVTGMTAGLAMNGNMQTALAVGEIASCLERFVSVFGADRFIFYDFDLLQRSAEEASLDLQSELGLRIEHPPSVDMKIGSSTRYNMLGRIPGLRHGGPLLRRLSPELYYRVRYIALKRLLYRKLQAELQYDEIAAGYEILSDRLEREITRLEQRLCRDLSHWRIDRQLAELRSKLPRPAPLPFPKPSMAE